MHNNKSNIKEELLDIEVQEEELKFDFENLYSVDNEKDCNSLYNKGALKEVVILGVDQEQENLQIFKEDLCDDDFMSLLTPSDVSIYDQVFEIDNTPENTGINCSTAFKFTPCISVDNNGQISLALPSEIVSSENSEDEYVSVVTSDDDSNDDESNVFKSPYEPISRDFHSRPNHGYSTSSIANRQIIDLNILRNNKSKQITKLKNQKYFWKKVLFNECTMKIKNCLEPHAPLQDSIESNYTELNNRPSRSRHNHLERMRRTNLAKLFNELAQVTFPCSPDKKRSKLCILNQSIKIIQQYKDIELTKNININLRSKLEELLNNRDDDVYFDANTNTVYSIGKDMGFQDLGIS